MAEDELTLVRNCDELNRLIALLPEAEQTAGVMLAGSLVRLSEFRNDYAAALSLADFADSQGVGSVLDYWRDMAGRSAVLAVFHFGHTLAAISQNAEKTPSLHSIEGRKLRKDARNEYEAAFSHVQNIRDAICHVAQNTLTITSVESHWRDGTLYYGKMLDRELNVTKKGCHYKFKLDQNSLSLLIKIGQLVYDSLPTWKAGLPDLTRLSDKPA